LPRSLIPFHLLLIYKASKSGCRWSRKSRTITRLNVENSIQNGIMENNRMLQNSLCFCWIP
jgi:hypothetical protein